MFFSLLYFQLFVDLFVTPTGWFSLKLRSLNEKLQISDLHIFVYALIYKQVCISQKQKSSQNNTNFLFLSDPDRIQTCNPQSRNLIFYSVELRGLLINIVFTYSLPIPDFKYFSLFLASILVLKFSFIISSQGTKALVDLLSFLSCSLTLLSRSFVNPV